MKVCPTCKCETEGDVCPVCGAVTVEQDVAADTQEVAVEHEMDAQTDVPAQDETGATPEKVAATKAVAKKAPPVWMQKVKAFFGKVGDWCKRHKLWTGVIAAALVAVIVTSSVLGGVLGNKFRLGKVMKVELGYTNAQVEKILGKPYRSQYVRDNKIDIAQMSLWIYYPGSTERIIKKLDSRTSLGLGQPNTWWEKLLYKTGLWNAEKQAQKEMQKRDKLSAKLGKKPRKEMRVDFGDGGVVESVVLDMARWYTADYTTNQALWKTVERTALSVDAIEARRVDGRVEIVTDLTKVVQSIWYTDGSFERAYYDIELTETVSDPDNIDAPSTEHTYMWSEKGLTVEGDSVRLRLRTALPTKYLEVTLPLHIVV